MKKVNPYIETKEKEEITSVVTEEKKEERKEKGEKERSTLSKKLRSVFLYLMMAMIITTLLSVIVCGAWIITYFVINQEHTTVIRKANMDGLYSSVQVVLNGPRILAETMAPFIIKKAYGANASFVEHKEFLARIVQRNQDKFPSGIQVNFIDKDVTIGIKRDPRPEVNIFQMFFAWEKDDYKDQLPNTDPGLFYYNFKDFDNLILEDTFLKRIPPFRSLSDGGSQYLLAQEKKPKAQYIPSFLVGCPTKELACSHVIHYASQHYDSVEEGFISASLQLGYFSELLENIASEGVESLLLERQTNNVIGSSVQNKLYEWSEEEQKHLALTGETIQSMDMRAAVAYLRTTYGDKFENLKSDIVRATLPSAGGYYNYLDAKLLSLPGNDMVLIQIVNVWQYIGTATIIGIILGVVCLVGVLFAILFGFITSYIIYRPLRQFLKALNGITDGLNLENIQLGKRPFFTEFDQLHVTFLYLVKKLKFYRTFLPDHILKQVERVEQDKQGEETESTMVTSTLASQRSSHKSRRSSIGSTSSVQRHSLSSGLTSDSATFLSITLNYSNMNDVISNMKLFSDLLHVVIKNASIRHGYLERFSENEIIIGFNTITKIKNSIFAAAEIGLKLVELLKKKQEKTKFVFGIGLSTSKCYMGTIGSNEKRSWKSIGPALPRGLVMSQLSILLETPLLMDEDCESTLSETEFQRRLADQVYLKDQGSVRVYQLVSKVVQKNDEWIYELRNKESSSWCSSYNDAVEALKHEKLSEAAQHIESFLDKNKEDFLGKNLSSLIENLYQSSLSFDEYLEQRIPTCLSMGSSYKSLLCQSESSQSLE